MDMDIQSKVMFNDNYGGVMLASNRGVSLEIAHNSVRHWENMTTADGVRGKVGNSASW